MFLPFVSFGDESADWWEATTGLDIALLLASVLTAGLALATLTRGNPAVGQLAVIAAGVMFLVSWRSPRRPARLMTAMALEPAVDRWLPPGPWLLPDR